MGRVVFIASDHVGMELKEHMVNTLAKHKLTVIDLGPQTPERVNFTDFARLLCERISDDNKAYGILICGTGIGMSMMANRFKQTRAAVCVNEYMAEMTRRHNDANILCLGSRVIGLELAEAITIKFLSTKFDGGRHFERVQQLDC